MTMVVLLPSLRASAITIFMGTFLSSMTFTSVMVQVFRSMPDRA